MTQKYGCSSPGIPQAVQQNVHVSSLVAVRGRKVEEVSGGVGVSFVMWIAV
eukprot:CAMPEP_0204350390 /NCGR_PEP_ID=MMETSP0469-20131031/30287_1 /ASSEMBLY_ACC=CAM_ASM_000384 /TAXON_ID=2969 /ORGANISM="Oxyrrhis marina" /LENGTH=50 /DNA_ID=CAMNT_0051336735 /DNA_START=88 /DNA_END=237 /DNA_ORIENTATION=+